MIEEQDCGEKNTWEYLSNVNFRKVQAHSKEISRILLSWFRYSKNAHMSRSISLVSPTLC